jgi:hypothetical protein
MNDLNAKLAKEPWFHSIEADQFGNLIVYAKYLSLEVYKAVPDTFGGKSVKVHFAAHKEAKPTTYVSPAAQGSFWDQMQKVAEPAKNSPDWMHAGINLNPQNFETFSPPKEEDLEADLVEDLWELKKICGEDNLAEIFFEIHDQEDAITNKSKEFPGVRKAMEQLYETYGFDVLFNEIERD